MKSSRRGFFGLLAGGAAVAAAGAVKATPIAEEAPPRSVVVDPGHTHSMGEHTHSYTLTDPTHTHTYYHQLSSRERNQ